MSGKQSVRIGTAGWNIPRDSVADAGGEGSHLVRYSRIFRCVEINSSFYRPHKLSTWERWRDSVVVDFQFSVKAPRAITHDARLRCEPKVLLSFLDQVAELREKLGPILIQLPPSLEFECDIARSFFTLLRLEFSGDVVCEPRHRSWFEDAANDLLKEYRVGRVAADPAIVPLASHPGGASEVVYFRLHGSPRLYYSEYDEQYLAALAAELADHADRSKTWCVFDNTASGAAIRNAFEVSRLLPT
jgi:uncharacterized protein YecE (DUF72 family)